MAPDGAIGRPGVAFWDSGGQFSLFVRHPKGGRRQAALAPPDHRSPPAAAGALLLCRVEPRAANPLQHRLVLPA